MKLIKISAIALLFLSEMIIAQPAVTVINFPIQGSTITNYSGTAIKPIDDVPGAGQVWDLSKIPFNYINELNFKDGSGTKFSSEFPSSNVLFEIKECPNDYTYYSLSEHEVKYLGFASSSGETPVVAKYDNEWLVYSLPLRYNDAGHDNFSSTSTVIFKGDTSNNFSTAEYTYTVDGYGTLITPLNTYPNVLRISSVIIGRDSSVHHGTLDSTIVNSYRSRNTYWISTGENDAGIQASTPDFINFYFQDNAIALNVTSEYNWRIILVYPDPATGFINFELPKSVSGKISVSIYDNLGSIAKSIEMNSSSDLQKLQIPVNDLVPGYYIITAKTAKGGWISRFVKQ